MAFYYDRRTFLKNSATWAAAIPAAKVLGTGVTAHGASMQGGSLSSALDSGFLNPPDDAWPWVFWFASDGNITREGITADLEAMHRVGIRGVLYMEVDQNVPKGPARFLSPEWRELIQHAMKEATRLGITVDMNNDGGWCGSGGPWITPDLSMQMMVWSETSLQGPAPFAGVLAQPKTVRDYYRDIAVLAFPTPQAEGVRWTDHSPRLTCGADRKPFDSANFTDGNPGSVGLLPFPEKGQPQYLNIEFPESFTARAVTVALDRWSSEIPGEFQASDDGQEYRTIRATTFRWPVSSVNFPEVTSRHFRILLRPPDTTWGDPMPEGIPLGGVELHPDWRIEDIPGKAAYRRLDVLAGQPALSPEAALRRDQVVDLTGKLDQEGRLRWDVPPGKWTVLRIGHTSTGKVNHPAPEESLGLECDKLSKKALDVHFAGMMGKLLEDQAAVGAKALKMTHIDSWETGSQNWTPGLREEFRKRCGYDLFPYLPLLTGRIVESPGISERVLWDLRRTIADLLLENYADYMRELAHKHGLILSIEAYGDGPLEEVAFGGRADVPMGEFWMGNPSLNGVWSEIPLNWVKEMTSSGHVYGRPVIGAESFTSFTPHAKWQNHPFQLKPLGDWAFTQGINRFVFHRYSMQPWMNRWPGMTMGPWGINYERTNTWWEQSREWHFYLARCQFLLQKGLFVADVACLGSENAPNSFPSRESIDPPIPAGYDYDCLPPEVLLRQATVRDGQLVLASGMTYRVLLLPPGRTITPILLGKIKELVVAGLTVVGPRPGRSPSLQNYPQCDDDVRKLADELWGECDGVGITENRCGKGSVIWGRPLMYVFKDQELPPDLTCPGATVGDHIRYIHRTMEGDDVYFVASSLPEARRFTCNFRVQGKRPELWWPDTGRKEIPAVYQEQDGSTRVPIALDPCGSVFVVFRSGTKSSDRLISVRREGVEISGVAPTPGLDKQLQQEFGILNVKGDRYSLEIATPGTYELRSAAGRPLKVEVPALPGAFDIQGPWELEFPKGWGAPDRLTLERLISWTDHPNPGVKHFSGTATYRRQFKVPAELLGRDRRLYLDLGRVFVIAQATLNGHDLGVLWKPPFSVDVTEELRAGTNDLTVAVVNLWPNRLIGDDLLPDDSEWDSKHWGYVMPGGEVLRRYPKWLLEGKPHPAGRLTFAPWKLWTKDDALLVSGLLGPVTLRASYHVEFGP